jgi:hypothetical protein
MAAPLPLPLPTRTPEYLAESLGPQIIATASAFIILSTVFVALRYYARYLTQTKFGLEDIITPFAWLAEIGLCITAIGKLNNPNHLQTQPQYHLVLTFQQ